LVTCTLSEHILSKFIGRKELVEMTDRRFWLEAMNFCWVGQCGEVRL
jgi:hypothetical protein